MRPRLIRRILGRQSQSKSPTKTIRTFTQNHNSRPQLPFLSIPSRFRRQQWRYLTTERKRWLKGEAILTVKYTGYIWGILAFAAAAAFAIHQEFLEQQYPTPHEWSFRTRMLKRAAEAEKNRPGVIVEDWVLIVQMLNDVIARLEDPSSDGKGLNDLGPDAPAGSKDITAKPEPWRRGYYEALLLQAAAAEHVEGWVLDTKRKIAFPPDVVRGPSNPSPKPIPAGSKSAPREEDCVPAGFPDPDACYQKLLATAGLTPAQRIGAALAYANWLEYKGFLGPAAVQYNDAVNLAVAEIHTPGGAGAPALVDPETAVLDDRAPGRPPPSANLLRSLTALAAFRARSGDVSAALPIMISILKARRSLPAGGQQMSPGNNDNNNNNSYRGPPTRNFLSPRAILDWFTPPAYPPPPPDGASPPVRDSRELCEEAALHLHIGEIMYTLRKGSSSSTTKNNREDGLAWTREGVDLAEEELHKVLEEAQGRGKGLDRGQSAGIQDAKKTCRECLASGLDNWAAMVGRLAREEQAAKAGGQTGSSSSSSASSSSSSTAGWFGLGLWSKGGKGLTEEEIAAGGRWAAEQKVVTERTARAQEILEDLQPPPSQWLSSFLKA
ncbi:hypothetical protein SLS53_003920 [Cytospora paraplurivora]|uniref:MFS maltose permease n=1 Tax=Cytospora paraplurivora TaxID=2898453 RepID=A0AAN9YGI2_9PEZI